MYLHIYLYNLNWKCFFDIIFKILNKHKGIFWKLTVAISGASGANLGLTFVKNIPRDIEVFLVLSKSAKIALKLENGMSVKKTFEEYTNIKIFLDTNIAAPIASGSFHVDKMIIIPCSMNTLAKCAVGISDSSNNKSFHCNAKREKRYNFST